MYQERYWNLLKELKAQIIYLHCYAVNDEAMDKIINIFLAISASSSIAAWAIWKEYQIIWATIIAMSQVVSAIKPFLPFKQRLQALTDLNTNLQSIFLDAEKGWYKVSEGLLNEEEIHNETSQIKDSILSAERNCLNSVIIPRKNKIKNQAEKIADEYFTQNYLGI